MVASESQRRIRRSKQSERNLGKYLKEHDGDDEKFKHIATSTNRVGQISDLQFDVVSLHYAAENKQVRVPKRILDWWVKINMVAAKHHKQPLLRIEPTNEGKFPELHIITSERHAHLLDTERRWEQVVENGMC